MSGFIGNFLLFILARQSTVPNLSFGFLILQLHPCCIQAEVRAGLSSVWGMRQGGFGWDPKQPLEIGIPSGISNNPWRLAFHLCCSPGTPRQVPREWLCCPHRNVGDKSVPVAYTKGLTPPWKFRNFVPKAFPRKVSLPLAKPCILCAVRF